MENFIFCTVFVIKIFNLTCYILNLYVNTSFHRPNISIQTTNSKIYHSFDKEIWITSFLEEQDCVLLLPKYYFHPLLLKLECCFYFTYFHLLFLTHFRVLFNSSFFIFGSDIHSCYFFCPCICFFIPNI